MMTCDTCAVDHVVNILFHILYTVSNQQREIHDCIMNKFITCVGLDQCIHTTTSATRLNTHCTAELQHCARGGRRGGVAHQSTCVQ